MGGPYTLYGWETTWLANNTHLPAEMFVSRYLRLRTRRIGSDGERRAAIRLRNLIDRNWSHFKDQSLRAEHLLTPPGGPPQTKAELYKSFRDYWRGCTDDEFDRELADIKKKLRDLGKKTRRYLQRAQRKLLSAKRRRQEGRFGGYQRLVDRLERLAQDINNMNASNVCEQRLWRQADRHGPPFHMDEVEHLELRCSLDNPSQADMPLRFLVDEPLGLWQALHYAWERRSPRGELLQIVEEHINPEDVLAEIRDLDNELVSKGYPGRPNALKELEVTWRNGAYLACALLATTQAEGCLWDLAKMMNKKGWRIFRTRPRTSGRIREGYKWDRAAGRYERGRDGKYVVGNRPLSSARALLKETRLSTLFNAEVFSYLIDEHSEVRNMLAHGDTAQRPAREDSFAAMLCIRAIYQQILEAR